VSDERTRGVLLCREFYRLACSEPLLRLEGVSVGEIAVGLKTTPKRVSIWSKRFETRGLAGLEEAAGRGRKPSLPEQKIERVVTEVTRPPTGRSRWSVRSVARHAGISPSSVQRIWSKDDLKPHVVKTFKLSNAPPLTIRPPRKMAIATRDPRDLYAQNRLGLSQPLIGLSRQDEEQIA